MKKTARVSGLPRGRGLRVAIVPPPLALRSIALNTTVINPVLTAVVVAIRLEHREDAALLRSLDRALDDLHNGAVYEFDGDELRVGGQGAPMVSPSRTLPDPLHLRGAAQPGHAARLAGRADDAGRL
jgi:hypothetical protein